jgi:GNAT superfamily N-acetyltransferase
MTMGLRSSALDVVRYDESMYGEVLAFQPLAYPNRRRDWIEPRWNWMFIRSAERVGVPPHVWVQRDVDGVHGQRGAIMVRVHCRSTAMVAGWLVDTAVLPHLRGHGIGHALVERATRDLPLGLSLGQTGQIRALQDRHGWRPVATMHSWSLVLQPGEAFRRRVPNALVRLGLAWAAFTWRVARAALAPGAGPYQVRHVSHFDAAYDRLWERVRCQFDCLVIRDASYLNWKYVEQPGITSRRLAVLDASGEVRGVCIWVKHAPDGTHAYTRGWILDVVVDPARGEDVRAVLAAVVEDAQAESVAVLEFDLLAPALVPFLRRSGWIRGGATRQLRVAAHDLPEDLAARLVAPAAWFLTRGDSDGDHPWWTPCGRHSGALSA